MPGVRYMPGSWHHSADAAVYRCLRVLHDRARHTGATWQPQGKNLSPVVMQGHTVAATELKVGITQCMYVEICCMRAFDCDLSTVLLVET